MIKQFIFLLLFMGMGFSQITVPVDIDDWNLIRETALQTDSSLAACQELNILYEKRVEVFTKEVLVLRDANQLADSIIVNKNLQLDKSKEQVKIMEKEVKKKKLEIWLYRGGIVATALVFLLFG